MTDLPDAGYYFFLPVFFGGSVWLSALPAAVLAFLLALLLRNTLSWHRWTIG